MSPDGETAPPVRVMIVDDHPMWRDAVSRDLEQAGFAVVATGGDGAAAVRIAQAVRPDVLVMDLHLPELSGVQATERILAVLPETRVLVLSASGEQDDVLQAVKAGATGYLVKSASAAELVEAVERTAAGEATFTPGLAGLLLGEYRRLASGPTPEPGPRLTARETEVLRLVAKGLTARQVGTRLTVSTRTVQNHLQNAMGKLQVHNRAGLVRYAIEAGLDED
ncbi:MAG TPA: response regulator transcription factor [Cryptosporangiaceae bacterium]|nr:response regulator transcription factor [Cryptosporangiaceae bacterium]